MTTSVEYQNIPDSLKALKQWAVSRMPDKVPMTTSGTFASSTDSATWNTFEACRAFAAKKGWGIAFCFTPADSYAVIDLDHVRNPNGETEPWALAVIDNLKSYSEVSWSGGGWHIIVEGSLPGAGLHRGRIEMYDRAKFMTMTGNTVIGMGTLDIERRDLNDLYKRAHELDPSAKKSTTTASPTVSGDDSAADFALACRLVRQHGHDVVKVKEEFLKQAKPRPKLQRDSYVNITVQNAIAKVPIVETVQEAIEPEEHDLPAEALDSWLGNMCKERMAEFPLSAAWPALVTAASVHVPGPNRCNLFTTIVGRSGDGKGEVCNRAMWLMSADTEPLRKTDTPGSGEGLARMFKDANGRQRLLYQEEIADMMGKTRIESSSLGQKINQLWGTDRIGTSCKKEKDSTDAEVRLSLLGSLVDVRFDEAFNAGSALGQYRRTLFGEYPQNFPAYLYRPATGARAFVPAPPEGDVETDIPYSATERQPISVTIAADVWDERDRWVKQEGIDPAFTEPVLRVALICACFDNRPVLRADDLAPTLALLKYQAAAREHLKPNLGENQSAILHNKIMNYLRRFAPHGEPKRERDVLTRTHAYDRYGAELAERVVRSLASQNLIVRAEVPSTGPKGCTKTIALGEEERVRQTA